MVAETPVVTRVTGTCPFPSHPKRVKVGEGSLKGSRGSREDPWRLAVLLFQTKASNRCGQPAGLQPPLPSTPPGNTGPI